MLQKREGHVGEIKEIFKAWLVHQTFWLLIHLRLPQF